MPKKKPGTYKILLQFFFIITILTGAVTKTSALELYSIIENNETLSPGLILGINEDNLTLLLLDGNLKRIGKQDISIILVYNTLQNPFSSLNVNKNLTGYLREVHVDESEEPSFTALPVKLIDELVIFFDISGKVHVYEMSKLIKLRDYDYSEDKVIKLENYTPKRLNLGDVPFEGEKNKDTKDGIYATKIISDKIKIYEFLTDFQRGFQKINSYQERTYLYAKPYLFEEDTKLGNYFIFRGPRFKEEDLFNPYFKWSTGDPYAFQSQTIVGFSTCEWIPTLHPLPAIQSEVKSHFFNTMFVGNLNLGALPAGNQYYSSEDDYSSHGAGIKNNLIVNYDPFITTRLNYLLLLGVDYGPYSLSVGMYYPIYAIRVNDHFREVLASNTSPFLKLLFIKGDIRLKCMFSYIEYMDQKNGISKNLKTRYLKGRESFMTYDEENFYYFEEFEEDVYGYWEYSDDSITPVKKFNFFSYYTRIGIIYELTSKIKLSIDEVFIAGRYDETFKAEEVSDDYDYIYGGGGEPKIYDQYLNNIKFFQFNTGIKFQQNFGEYVSITMVFNYYIRHYDYDFFDITNKVTSKKYEYGGAFELIF